MTAYCHTKFIKLQVFRANKSGARLDFLEFLHCMMNLMVEWNLGSGGCRKMIFGMGIYIDSDNLSFSNE